MLFLLSHTPEAFYPFVVLPLLGFLFAAAKIKSSLVNQNPEIWKSIHMLTFLIVDCIVILSIFLFPGPSEEKSTNLFGIFLSILLHISLIYYHSLSKKFLACIFQGTVLGLVSPLILFLGVLLLDFIR